MWRRLAQPFYSAYVAVTFVCSILLIFPLVLVLSFRDHYKNRKIIFGILKIWSQIWLTLIGMPLRRMGPLPPSRKFIVVANHISYLDGVVIFPSIPGYFRALGKKEVSSIPVVGLIYKQLVIMVDRSNSKSRSRSMRLMWRFLKHEGNILIFPEGTFNETGKPLKEFYDGAFRLAINTGVDILPIIFPDTVNRWHYSAWWKFWPGKNRAYYCAPVPVAGMSLEDLQKLKAHVFSEMQQKLETIRKNDELELQKKKK